MTTVQIRKFADLGTVVKAVREQSGVRQEDLAESLGFSRNYLHSLESGRPNLFATRLFRTLNKLGIRVSVTYELPSREHRG